MPRRPSAAAVALWLVLLVAVVACDGGDKKAAPSASSTAAPTTAAPTTTAPPVDTSWVAKANKELNEVAVYASADLSAEPAQVIAQPNEDGAPLAFLIKGTYDAAHPPAALEVYLPVRPNGSSGFVKAADVTITSHRYKIKVEIGAHHLTVTNGDAVVLDTPVGIGTSDTPTPGGVFYIKELLKVPNPNGPYGPYAYGLSGFSEKAELANFAGGSGVIGIHGTNDPGSIGTDVSHGCIRMSNENITMLAGILPLGTPVEILP